ncbi:CIC11C00000004072 [Sungouiella intermedia]|uniref:CIC11C00000004072 n=1 Tax=Sungouiella intermedia TaxID=45354 RepID=A0A1L0BHD0_9ASCO|nr:CIC11C00000004072 [[Candida] intermedia]
MFLLKVVLAFLFSCNLVASACKPFYYDPDIGAYGNTTCHLWDSDDYEHDKRMIIYAYDNDAYHQFISVVGLELAIQVLEILKRLQDILREVIESHGDISSKHASWGFRKLLPWNLLMDK